MKSTGLLKLALLSLFLAAFWLSPAPGLEHPWDDDERVVTDSSTVLGGENPGVDDGSGLEDFDVLIIFSMPSIVKPLNFTIYRISSAGETLKKYKLRESPKVNRKLEYALPQSGVAKERK